MRPLDTFSGLDCHRKRRISPNSATVAIFGDSRRNFRRIGDCSLQCGQPISVSKMLLLLELYLNPTGVAY